MQIKIQKIEAGKYRVVGTVLTIERNDAEAPRWGERSEWLLCRGEEVLLRARSLDECQEGLQVVAAELTQEKP